MQTKELRDLIFEEIETALCGYHDYSEIYPSHIVQSANNATECILKQLELRGFLKSASKKKTKVRVNKVEKNA